MSLRKNPLHRVGALALAALAMTAVAAMIMLAAGDPAPASAGSPPGPPGPTDNTATPTPEPTPTPTPEPRPPHATPEACPGEPGNTNALKHVVDSGHYALFDVWWNPDEGELTNSVCPPSISDTGARNPSGINITAEPPTIIHIPSSARVDLSASTTYTEAKYQAVWDADNKENRDTDGDGTPDGVGDRIVWALPACPASASLPADDLCISFSAALLLSADWTGNIEYHVTHVHQIDIDRQDPRYILAYDGATDKVDLRWDSSDARVAVMPVAAGEYDRPLWFFTDRGTYELQVHIRGNPNQTPAADRTDGFDPISDDESVTSDVREYILHVGAEADLGVTVAVTPDSPSPGDDVTITIDASSAGPDEAPSTKVAVTLPDGLTYSSHSTATGTYDSSAGAWDIGRFANGASATLTITASVDAETHGKALDVKAAISATETVTITETELDENEQPVIDPTTGKPVKAAVEYDVPVPDPTPGNDTEKDTITVTSEANVDPMFQFTRSVPENSAAGTVITPAIQAYDPNSGDALTYSLTGAGVDNFAIDRATGAISVATNASIDYECKNRYHLQVHVSDGKNELGNSDPSIDDTNALFIDIEEDTNKDSADVLDALVGYTVTPSNQHPVSVGTEITMRVSSRSLTYTCPGTWRYVWEHQIDGAFEQMDVAETVDEITVSSDQPASRIYRLTVYFVPDGNPDAQFVVNGGLLEEELIVWK